MSLRLDNHSFTFLNDLRRQHFPRERNHLDAHVTLFHALPGEELERVSRDLADICARTPVLPLAFPAVRFIGRGVAVDIECPPVMRLRAHLAGEWRELLGAQDARTWKHPHVTVCNKVTSDAARVLFKQLDSSWRPFDGRGEGLNLWRYLGGPWEEVGSWDFGGGVGED